MVLNGENEAWIFPQKTATKAIRLAIGFDNVDDIVNQPSWHNVDWALKGDRQVYMTVRNPFTRLQSYWRQFSSDYYHWIGVFKKDELLRWSPSDAPLKNHHISFEQYVHILRGKQIMVSPLKIYIEYGEFLVPYPVPMVSYLKGHSVEEVKLIRFESLKEDLAELGYELPSSRKETRTVETDIDLDWYDDHPKLAGIVEQRYKKDFDTFYAWQLDAGEPPKFAVEGSNPSERTKKV